MKKVLNFLEWCLLWFLISIVALYRWVLSPLLGANCRFEPSCSCYALDALKSHGVWKGLALTLKRLGRCHPWTSRGGYDPVP